MTVIAWDGKTLAADRKACFGDTEYSTQKLWPLADGGALAFCGDLDCGMSMKRWYEEGADISKWPEFQKSERWALLIIALPGQPVIIYEKLPEAFSYLDPLQAWGSGREAALGAMAMGADAIKAVEIASLVVHNCGRGYDFVMVNK